jgi:hypothetical protein
MDHPRRHPRPATERPPAQASLLQGPQEVEALPGVAQGAELLIVT